ncbi:MAG TPA: ubiquinol-cytochrome c reductase iron-sulfur subunit [Candidatus Deferrimicrobium sp.]|nr:ubiquinol-cytochrome c reductase iron-sulfur subunit [Candidatus Deferrimicrobium sp.]
MPREQEKLTVTNIENEGAEATGWSRRAVLRLGWISVLASGILSLWPITKYLSNQAGLVQTNSITFESKLEAGSDWYKVPNSRVWVKRDTSGYTALLANCTHLGCEVKYHSEQAKWLCPCHGSSYDIEGRPVGGPAPKALQRVAVQIRKDNTLTIEVNKPVGMDVRAI